MLEELRDQSGVTPSAQELEMVRPLTWDEVGSLDRAGIEIGSHTVSHPFLVQLDDRELFTELSSSKARIEEQIGRVVSSLSYPTGGSEYFDSRSIRIASDCGYQSEEHTSELQSRENLVCRLLLE